MLGHSHLAEGRCNTSPHGDSTAKTIIPSPSDRCRTQVRRASPPCKQPLPSVGPQRFLEKGHCCPMRSPFLNGKQLGWFLSLTSMYPWPRPLTSLGNFSTMKQIGTTFLALRHTGLHSKCIDVKNPLEVGGFFLLFYTGSSAYKTCSLYIYIWEVCMFFFILKDPFQQCHMLWLDRIFFRGSKLYNKKAVLPIIHVFMFWEYFQLDEMLTFTVDTPISANTGPAN